ncbi:DUF6980 family protein [Hyphococcus sp.]|uniref:DUF6980 family protein n=1 Tax=Hyphococcus sp. TaxID=2038636 RepID=UPI0035C77408
MGNHPKKYYLEDEFPQFFSLLREGKVNISYSQHFREFSITLADGVATQKMEYCPWSGRKFPDSLRQQYFDTLKNEHSFDEPTMDDVFEKCVPLEMLSEAWWVKRGL